MLFFILGDVIVIAILDVIVICKVFVFCLLVVCFCCDFMFGYCL